MLTFTRIGLLTNVLSYITFESGEKHPSTGIPLLFKCPAKVCSGWPLKASRSLIRLPLVVRRIDLPFGLNLRPIKREIYVQLRTVKGNKIILQTYISSQKPINILPVHSHCFSWGSLNVTKGPLSNPRRSYSLTCSDWTPTEKTSPSGSNAQTCKIIGYICIKGL